jgi:integrase
MVAKLKTRQVTNSKPGYLSDGAGLYLQTTVGKEGDACRSWVFRFERRGKRREAGIGPLHTVGLAEARERAKTMRLLLLDGKDPIEHRLAERDKQRAEEAARVTFKEAAEQFLTVHESGWRNAKHRSQWRNTLKDYAYPTLGRRPVKAIDAAVINEALAGIWQRVPETANRVKWRVERVIKWVKDGKPLPTAAASKRAKHHAGMAHTDVPAFMVELRSRANVSARALEFLILTAARTGEVIGARWSEIDLRSKVWTVPPGRMKGSRAHRVPLSARVVAILEELPRQGAHVFGGTRPISHMTMLKLLRGMRPGLTVHGFRSAFRTWAGECTSTPREIAEAALAHVVGDKTEQAYQRGDLFTKRAKLMSDWERFCAKPGATVTPLRAGVNA